MKFLGNVDLQDNLILNPVLKPVENFPAESKVGQLIFKGQRVMICIDITNGLPAWAPLTTPLNTVIHEQTDAAVSWDIPHDLNTSSVIVQVIDINGKHIIADEVTCNYNSVSISFTEAISGRAVIMMGSTDGIPRANYAFEQSFNDMTTWTVNHMLGYIPLIRAFVGNQEVQPLSITHDNLNTTTITFSSAQTGHIRAM